MKNSAKKIISLFLASIVAATALIFNVVAAGPFDNAKTMKEMTYYSKKLSAYDNYYLKIKIPSNGKISFYVEKASDFAWGFTGLSYAILDSDGEEIKKGDLGNSFELKNMEIEKGTYYLKIIAGSKKNQSFENLYYSFTPDEEQDPTITLSLSIYEGTSLKLGAIVQNSDSGVTWASSKPKVVSVSSKGTIKALKAGTATIRATLESGEYVNIVIKVYEKD